MRSSTKETVIGQHEEEEGVESYDYSKRPEPQPQLQRLLEPSPSAKARRQQTVNRGSKKGWAGFYYRIARKERRRGEEERPGKGGGGAENAHQRMEEASGRGRNKERMEMGLLKPDIVLCEFWS